MEPYLLSKTKRRLKISGRYVETSAGHPIEVATKTQKPETKTLKKVIFSIKKLNISIEKVIIFIEKPDISIEKTNIFIKKLNISIEKANIFIKKLNISIEKLIIFIEKTNISIEKVSKTIKKETKTSGSAWLFGSVVSVLKH
jgi:hypothetical protein